MFSFIFFYFFFYFFFNDTATTEIYTLSLHDALPIHSAVMTTPGVQAPHCVAPCARNGPSRSDRKSTRLNSSPSQTSYAVFCLKKKRTRRVWSTISFGESTTGWSLYLRATS